MLLKNIDFSSSKDYLHMERYVNGGSPSGFTGIYSTSEDTRAKSDKESFYLCSVELPENITFQDFGVKPNYFKWQMLIHPDMLKDRMFSICSAINPKALSVAPTASSRTVKTLDHAGWFLKLNYKGLIGRIDRNIGRNQALSAIEVTNIIVNAIDSAKLPKHFFFQREPFARVVDLDDDGKPYEWGIVLREPTAYPNRNTIKYLIPAFALFSTDDRNPTDPTILTQLINKQGKKAEDFLLEDIISPVYEAYFNLLLNCGLQLECHAQNTLFAIGEDFEVVGVVAKDAESIDKDLALMEELKIKHDIHTIEYKCLKKEDYNYHIMHSFMFDFKLGEYLISPIIDDALKNFVFDKETLVSRIKKLNKTFIAKLPNDFFPSDGKWYSYENKVHVRSEKRVYIGKDNPQYR